jgi:hypothetical protein
MLVQLALLMVMVVIAMFLMLIMVVIIVIAMFLMLIMVVIVMIAMLFMLMVIMVVVVVFIPVGMGVRHVFHAFYKLLLHGIHLVHHGDGRRRVSPHGFQHSADPVFANAAVVDQQIGFLHRDHVTGGGLKAVCVHTGGQQEGDLRPLAGHLPGKIKGGEVHGDNLQFFLRRHAQGAGQHQAEGE